MNLNRRAFVAGSSGSLLALAGRVHSSASDGTPTPVAGLSPIDVGDVKLLSISPNGSTLLGKDGDALVFIDANSFETIAECDVSELNSKIDDESFAWSPDGSKVAFSLASWIQFIDSDIFTVDVETGTLINMTDEDGDGEPVSLMNIENVDGLLLDMYPLWLDDERLMFYRHKGAIASEQDDASTLVTATLDGNEIEPWANLTQNDLNTVYAPMHLLSDGSVLMMADTLEGNSRPLIARIDEEGGSMVLDFDDVSLPRLLDANDSHCLVLDTEQSEILYVPIDDPEARQPLYDVLGFGPFEMAFFQPALGPEPGTLVAVQKSNVMSVLIYDNGEVNEVAILEGEDSGVRKCIWVENRILVIGSDSNWIVDLEGFSQ